MFSTQFTSTAATAPSALPVDNATDRQIIADEAIAKALSREEESSHPITICGECSPSPHDTQSPPINQATTRRPKRKEKAPPTPEPSKKKKKPPPPTTSNTGRPRKSGLPDCSIHGCTRVVDRRGLCRLHAYGPKPENKSDKPKCSKPGCTRVVKARDLCRSCAYGTKKCSKPGCTNVAYRRGLCLQHSLTPEAYARYRERQNRSQNEHRRNNPNARISHNVRSRLSQALKKQGTSHQGKLKLLGCTAGQFKRYLALFFREPGNDWMDLGNHGRQEGARCWEMDHIKPLSSFNLKDPEQLRRAAHWSNFQPLSAADNGPGGKLIPDGFAWNGDRWMWSEGSGRINYDLPAADAEDVTIDEDDDEFDE